MTYRNSTEAALTLVTGALREGGATITAEIEGPEVPTAGYAVGGVVGGWMFPVDKLTPWEIELAVGSLIREAAPRGAFVGAWIDGGELYLDVTEYVPNRAAALALAGSRGGLAVWDVAAGSEVRVS